MTINDLGAIRPHGRGETAGHVLDGLLNVLAREHGLGQDYGTRRLRTVCRLGLGTGELEYALFDAARLRAPCEPRGLSGYLEVETERITGKRWSHTSIVNHPGVAAYCEGLSFGGLKAELMFRATCGTNRGPDGLVAIRADAKDLGTRGLTEAGFVPYVPGLLLLYL